MPDVVTVPADRRVLLVHAHPDDESIVNGATMARYAAEGAHVTVVTCTLGEEGEILVPELAGLAAAEADQLGGYRIWELRAAFAAMGVHDHRFLGGAGRFRDSGMMGDPANTKPRTFWGTPVDDAAAYLVPVVRELRPHVLVAYDDNGGYGHPDHIQAHRVAMRALELAAEPTYQPETEPWDIPKVYWSGIPRSAMQSAVDTLRAAGPERFGTAESVDEMPYVTPDELITTAVDGRKYVEAKLAAMRAHPTQILVDGPFFALSNLIGREALGVEYYRLVKGELGPRQAADGLEDDLFAGLER